MLTVESGRDELMKGIKGLEGLKWPTMLVRRGEMRDDARMKTKETRRNRARKRERDTRGRARMHDRSGVVVYASSSSDINFRATGDAGRSDDGLESLRANHTTARPLWDTPYTSEEVVK